MCRSSAREVTDTGRTDTVDRYSEHDLQASQAPGTGGVHGAHFC